MVNLQLARMETLESMDFRNLQKLQRLAIIESLVADGITISSSLERLSLRGSNFGRPTSVVCVGENPFSQLKVLDLGDNHFSLPDFDVVSDDFLAFVASSKPNIQVFHASKLDTAEEVDRLIESGILKTVVHLGVQLNYIHLSRSQIDSMITAAPNLETLDFENSHVSGPAVKRFVEKSKNLKTIDISRCPPVDLHTVPWLRERGFPFRMINGENWMVSGKWKARWGDW